MKESPPQPVALVLATLAAAALAVAAWHFAVHQGDDGFIFLRYAERLAAGRGLGFSDGMAPVEGFSSPLWWLLLSGFIGTGVPSIAASKILSALSLGALMAGLWASVRALGGRPVHAAVAWLGLALLRPPLFWAFTGLETPLAAAAMAWTAWGLARGRGSWAIGGALLGVLRPEGPGVAAVALVLGAWRDKRWPRLLEVGAVLGPAITWMAVRVVIYGDVLPNTFYAKAAGAPVSQVLRGLAYAGLLTPALALLALGWWMGRDTPARQGDPVRDGRAVPAVVALCATQLAVVIAGGGDWMWFGRLLVPVLPLVLALMVTARPGLPRWLGAGAVLALLPHLTPWTTWSEARALRPLPTVAWQEGGMTQAEAAAGRWIASHGQPGDLIAVNHAGALPWAAPDQRILDMTGLLDAHIAHQAEGGLHERYDVAYVLEQQPDWVVLHTRSPLGPGNAIGTPDYWVGETALFEDPSFALGYRATGAAWSWLWVAAERPSYTVVYQRVTPHLPPDR